MIEPTQVVAAGGLDWRADLDRATGVRSDQTRFELNPTSAALRQFLHPDHCPGGRLAVLGGYHREGVGTLAYLHAYAWLASSEQAGDRSREVWISSATEVLPPPQVGLRRLDIVDLRQAPPDSLTSIEPVGNVLRLVLTGEAGVQASCVLFEAKAHKGDQRAKAFSVGGLTRAEVKAYLTALVRSLGAPADSDSIDQVVDDLVLWRGEGPWAGKRRCRVLLGVAKDAVEETLLGGGDSPDKGAAPAPADALRAAVRRRMHEWACEHTQQCGMGLKYILEVCELLVGGVEPDRVSQSPVYVPLGLAADLVTAYKGFSLAEQIAGQREVLLPDTGANRLYAVTPWLWTAHGTDLQKTLADSRELVAELKRRASGSAVPACARALWLLNQDRAALGILDTAGPSTHYLDPIYPARLTSEALRRWAERVDRALPQIRGADGNQGLASHAEGARLLAFALECQAPSHDGGPQAEGPSPAGTARPGRTQDVLAALRQAQALDSSNRRAVFDRFLGEWPDCTIDASLVMLGKASPEERQYWMQALLKLLEGQREHQSVLALWDHAHDLDPSLADALAAGWAGFVLEEGVLQAMHLLSRALLSGRSPAARAIATSWVRTSRHPLTIAQSLTLLTDGTDVDLHDVLALVEELPGSAGALELEEAARVLEMYGRVFAADDRIPTVSAAVRRACKARYPAAHWVATRAILDEAPPTNSDWLDMCSECTPDWRSIVGVHFVWTVLAAHEGGLQPRELGATCQALSHGFGREVSMTELRSLLPGRAEPDPPPRPKPAAGACFERAEKLKQASLFIEQHDELRAGLEIDPSHAPAWGELAELYLRLHRPAAAAEVIRRALKAGATSARLKILLARLLLEDGQTDACLELLAPLRTQLIPSGERGSLLRLGSEALQKRGNISGALDWSVEFLRRHGLRDAVMLERAVSSLCQVAPDDAGAERPDLLREFVVGVSDSGTATRLRLALTAEFPDLALDALRESIAQSRNRSEMEVFVFGHSGLEEFAEVLRLHSLSVWADVVLGIHLAICGRHIHAHSLLASAVGRIRPRPDIRFIAAACLLATAADLADRGIYHNAIQLVRQARHELSDCEWHGLGGIEVLRVSTRAGVLQMLLEPTAESDARGLLRDEVMRTLSFLCAYYPSDETLPELVRQTLIADLRADLTTATRHEFWPRFADGLDRIRDQLRRTISPDQIAANRPNLAAALIAVIADAHSHHEDMDLPPAKAVAEIDGLLAEASLVGRRASEPAQPVEDQVRAGETAWNEARLCLYLLGRPGPGGKALRRALATWVHAQQRLESDSQEIASSRLGIDLGFRIRRATDLCRELGIRSGIVHVG